MGPNANWRVEDGALVVTGTGARRDWGFLLTTQEYCDFLLRFQFQMDANTRINSGVAFWAAQEDLVDGLPHPPQIEILSEDAPVLKHGSFFWSSSLRAPGALPPDRPANLRPGGHWNDAELEVRRGQMRYTVNGQQLLLADLQGLAKRPGAMPALLRTSGKIGFQSHTGTVRFREIEVKELLPVDPLLPGSVWAGRRTYPNNFYNGCTVNYYLHVEERHGPRFKGRVHDGGRGDNLADVEGEIRGGTLSWQERWPWDVKPHWLVQGTLAGDTIRITFRANLVPNVENQGHGELFLENADGGASARQAQPVSDLRPSKTAPAVPGAGAGGFQPLFNGKDNPGVSQVIEPAIRRGMRWTGTKVWYAEGASYPLGTIQIVSLEISEMNGTSFRGIFKWGRCSRELPSEVSAQDRTEITG